MTQSNGLVRAFREIVGYSAKGSFTLAGVSHIVGPKGLAVGFLAGSEGLMKVSGGTSSVHSNMTVGDCPSNAVGTVYVQGGDLFVTNVAGNATLDIRNGWVLLTAGQLTVDKLVITGGEKYVQSLAAMTPGKESVFRIKRGDEELTVRVTATGSGRRGGPFGGP